MRPPAKSMVRVTTLLLVALAFGLSPTQVFAETAAISTAEGSSEQLAHDRLRIWANSPEVSVAIDNGKSRGFFTWHLRWENCLAGSFVSTPEGVVIGTSRDGSPITASVTLQPGERQSWGARPNVTGAYRFGVIASTYAPLPGEAVFNRLARGIAARNTLFLMHLGDGVREPEAAKLAEFRQNLSTFKFPTYCLPGEAEERNGGLKAWSQHFGEPQFSFRVGPDRFVTIANGSGVLSPSQEKWLSTTLAEGRRSGARNIFVFANRPLVDIRPGKSLAMQDRTQVRRLLALFAKHRVHSVFGGHLRFFGSETRKGIRLVTTGGGGARPSLPTHRGGFHHWVRVDVDQNGRVAITPERLTL
ncbi:MAG: hypothetical protein VKP62_02360 [Candidatus Sericytochromatia bacterium]|nr:hypothetical protein [Candidatus Sericytochromatia bacterium]